MSQDSQRLYTASADNSCKIWDVNTGKELYHWEHPTPCRQCALSTGDKFVANALYPRRGEGLPSTVKIFKLEDDVSQREFRAKRRSGLQRAARHTSAALPGQRWLFARARPAGSPRERFVFARSSNANRQPDRGHNNRP